MSGRNAFGSIALLLLLGGCCSSAPTDPRTGGLVGGVCGEATGAYDARIAQRTDILGSLDAANAELAKDLRSTQAEAAGLARRIAAGRQRAAADRAALAALERELAAAERSGRLGRARKAALDADVRRLDGELAGLIAQASQRELALRALRQGVNTAREARDLETEVSRDERRRDENRRELDALRQRLRATAGG